MRLVVSLVVLGAIVSCEIVKMSVRSRGSLRARLLKEGKLAQWVAEVNRRKAEQRSTGSQPIIDYFDDYYLGSIQLGTPPQTFTNMVIATASANLWVVDASCRTTACNGTSASNYTKKHFDGSKSSTYQSLATLFSLQFNTGNIRGHYAIDSFTLGGLNFATQQFGLATSVADEFGDRPIDGILGLAWPSLAANNVVPPMQNLLPQLDAPVFTIWFDRVLGDPSGQAGGLATYGAIDTTNCDANVQYAPLTSETYWQFATNGFSVGSYSNMARQTAISDSQLSGLWGPSADMNGALKVLGATYDFDYDLYKVDCNATGPDVVYTINGRQYSIPFVEYVLDIGLGDGSCAVTFYPNSGGGFGPAWLLGDTFIRTFCNIYDIGNKRIGFALAKHGQV